MWQLNKSEIHEKLAEYSLFSLVLLPREVLFFYCENSNIPVRIAQQHSPISPCTMQWVGGGSVLKRAVHLNRFTPTLHTIITRKKGRDYTKKPSTTIEDEFWSEVAPNYFPALPPLQHVPHKTTYLARSEGEDHVVADIRDVNSVVC